MLRIRSEKARGIITQLSKLNFKFLAYSETHEFIYVELPREWYMSFYYLTAVLGIRECIAIPAKDHVVLNELSELGFQIRQYSHDHQWILATCCWLE